VTGMASISGRLSLATCPHAKLSRSSGEIRGLFRKLLYTSPAAFAVSPTDSRAATLSVEDGRPDIMVCVWEGV
jgi:hypothetical protein